MKPFLLLLVLIGLLILLRLTGEPAQPRETLPIHDGNEAYLIPDL